MNSQKHALCTLLRNIVSKDLYSAPVELPPKVIDWATQTRLGSVLIDHLETTHLTSEKIDSLKAEELTAKFWYQTQYQTTLELIAELNNHNIIPTLLKGMSVSTEFYPKAYFRSMRDVDILVEESEIEQVEKTMVDLGYKQSSPLPLPFYETHHHTIPWQHKTKDVWFEIHRRIFPESSPSISATVFKIDTLNSEKLISPIDSNHDSLKTYRLGYELQIIYIAAHWAESFKQIGGLFAFIDTALMINNTKLDWNKLIKWSNEPCIGNYVYILLSYLVKQQLVKDPQIKQHLKKINHNLSFIDIVILNKIITKYLLFGKPFGRFLSVDNINILWTLFISPKSAITKIILAPTYIIFPPSSEKKFNLLFQLSRVKNLLFKPPQ